jgi:acyl-coenzyme A synthetase/AMP-(fatty) acid ligase
VRFIDELPRTTTGKIQKRHLRELFTASSSGSEPVAAEVGWSAR